MYALRIPKYVSQYQSSLPFVLLGNEVPPPTLLTLFQQKYENGLR